MAITIDWPTGVINVPRNDLVLVQSTPTEIREMDLNWFRLQLKDLEDSPEGIVYLKTHDHNTEVNLGGITFARIIEILEPYTVTFENGYYAVNLIGANSNVGDKVNVNNVSVRSQNSAGLISSPLIEYAAFEGGIWLDQTNGTEGTIFPTGTHLRPVKNLSDAKIIADYRGFNVIYIVGDAVIDSGIDFNEFVFEGQTHVNNQADISPTAQVYGAVFRNLTVTGTLDGGNEIVLCTVSGVTYVNGHIHDCELVGQITLAGNMDAIIANCITYDPYQPPVINMGGSGQNLVLPNYSGLLTIENFNDPTGFIGIGMNAGETRLDSTSVFAGTIQIAGVGALLDENGNSIRSGLWNGGVTIINHLMSKETVAEAVESEIGTEIQYGVFGGKVWVDTNIGVSGTTYPAGSQIAPSNNLSDAVAIAIGRGFTTIHFLTDYTFDSSVNISDFNLEGEGKQTTEFTFTGAYVLRCIITHAYCTGNLTGIIGWEDSHLYNLESTAPIPTSQTIVIQNSVIEGYLRVPSGYTGTVEMLDCWGMPDALGVPPTLDFNGSSGKVQGRNYSGLVSISNVTNPSSDVRIFLNSGGVTLNPSVTAGTLRFTGIGNLTNNSTSVTTLDISALISKGIIAQAVQEEIGTEIEFAAFDGAAHIDINRGVTGTTYPIGTHLTPSNNLADTKTIALARGFQKIHLGSELTIRSGEDISGFTINSENWEVVTLESGSTCNNTIFDKVALYGPLSGVWNVLNDCWIYDVTNFSGWMRKGSIDKIKLAPSLGLEFGGQSFFDSLTPMYPNGTAQIILNTDTEIEFSQASGNYELIGSTSGCTTIVEFAAGLLSINSGCTGGDITVRGVGELINNSSLTINDEGLMSQSTVSTAVWDEPLADHVTVGTTGRILSKTSFNGKVWMDSAIGVTGTTFPIGTESTPSSFGADALAIAVREGIEEFRLNGTFISTQNVSGYTIGGDTWLDDTFVLNGTSYNYLTFRDIYLTGNPGSLGDNMQYKNCYIKDITNIAGEMIGCRIKDNISVAPGRILSGVAIIAEGDYTTIDLQGVSGTTVSLDIDSGYVLFINSVPGCLIEVNLKGGEIELDASCTGGDFYAEGVGTLYGDPVALGFNIKANNLIDNVTITRAVWDEQKSTLTVPGSIGEEVKQKLPSIETKVKVIQGLVS